MQKWHKWQTLAPFLKHRKWAFAGMGALAGSILIIAVIAKQLATPEESDRKFAPVTAESLLERGRAEKTLAPQIPDQIPDYSIENSSFSSVQSGVKQWKLVSKRSNLFSGQKLVHAREVIAHLYDEEGQTTVITGREARYFLDRQDLEIYGDVKTTFPDGFVLLSPYLRYRPKEHRMEIPTRYAVQGMSGPPPVGSKQKPGSTDDIRFDCKGFDFSMEKSVIDLPSDVLFVIERKTAEGDHHKEKTEIRSDRALIFREEGRAEFSMSRFRMPASRFVVMTQPDLYARGRRAELYYTDQAQRTSSNTVRYMSAFEDVLIKEKGSTEELRYSTSGQADFDTEQDVIVLTQFPQVYQGDDTIAGDRIILHKASDLVEVENSNAYNKGR